MSFVKKHRFGVALGALLVVGGSYAAAQAASTPRPQQVSLTQAQAPAEGAPAAKTGHRRLGLGLRRLVHGDLVVQGKDNQLRNIRLDHGVLQAVDGSTIAIKEADGSTVDIATTDQTRVVRDGQVVKIGDLRAGDNVWTVRVKDDNGTFMTMRVRAISPERTKELESKRQNRGS